MLSDNGDIMIYGCNVAGNLDGQMLVSQIASLTGADVAASAKAIKEYAKKNDKLEIKGGIMDGAAVSAAEVEAIASLPSREELYAHIAAAINGVAQGLATAIAGVPRGLAQVTKAVADQKEAA